MRALALHREAVVMVAMLSEQERASPEAEQVIRESLQEISPRVNEMVGLLD